MHRFSLRLGTLVLAALALYVLPVLTARPLERAVWLWDPKPALTDAAARASLLDFLDREHVTVVWAQIGLEGANVSRQAEWNTFIADAGRRRIRIEALDGDPAWAQQEAPAKRVLEAVLAYNVAVGADARFSGMHFDIEPHQLWAWRSPKNRQMLLRRYLELLGWCKERMALEFPGMALGADIPFWWQTRDEKTRRPVGDVEFHGVTKPASFHVIDMLDNVGIMSYRNRAAGNNGIVAISQDVLTYADKAGTAAIWVGVETSREKPGLVWFTLGMPSAAASAALEHSPDIGEDGRYKGFKVAVVDDGGRTYVGLSVPNGERESPSVALRAALASLARTFGTDGTGHHARDSEAGLIRRLSRDAEFADPRPRNLVDPESRTEYAGVVVRTVMPATLTFDGLPADTFMRETDAAEKAFAAHPRFRGLAIHHVDSYRALLKAPARRP